MNKLVTFLIAFCLLGLFAKDVYSQDRVVNGRVYTFDSIPLINASVKIKSTKQIVYTDTLGNFYAPCNYQDQIKVWARGFSTEKIKVDSIIKLVVVNLDLKPGQKNREYAIGYGHVTDAERLISVSNLNNDDVDFSQYTDIFELIRGRFPSVQIINNEIIIRGQNSLFGSNAALIIIDGSPVETSALYSLPPSDVKSINIVKDSGSAIYGARGANGVVIIETKRGGDM
jgi:TonB-dependent SusC/RagA subfamily outer membrane receptor